MAQPSRIEWTEYSWNPVTGCTKVSSGCNHCYAERMARRLKAMGVKRYKSGFEVTIHNDLVEVPIKLKKPHLIFVNSMSDLFHNDVPLSFIRKIFQTMERAKWHTFQILTKRPDRLAELSPVLKWSKNIWVGVTVENSSCIDRISYLKNIPAQVRFLSLEPLLSPLPNIDLSSINWVIVGGESGPKARPIAKEWVEDIQRQCQEVQIPFFFKQWGGVNKKEYGRILNGKTYSQMPLVTKN